MKKNKSKIKKIIIILIIILVICLFFAINFAKNKRIKNNSNDEITVIRGLDNKYPNGTFMLSKKYNGIYEMNELSTIVSRFMTSSIPTLKQITNKYNNKELKKYYESHINEIKELFGNIDIEEFLQLSNLIDSLTSNKLTYKNSEYLIDSLTISNNKYYVDLNITYENEETIKVKIVINNAYKDIKIISAINN